jgi:2-keto-myo-inositol isomerase
MKIGFNEGCNRYCPGQSVLEDVALCDKVGFDYIDIQSECLDRDLSAGKYTLADLAVTLRASRVKMLSYNALCGFNLKETQAERDAVFAQLEEILHRCDVLGCGMVVVVPSGDPGFPATRGAIREDAVRMLREMAARAESHGVRLSLEFCGRPSATINRFEDAWAIVRAVDSPLVGLTLDHYHFHAMASDWAALEQADGAKIFVWHLNGAEDFPCGAAYNTDEARLWPGAAGDCLDHRRFADVLKRIGYAGGVCTVEVFRPEYYRLTPEENLSAAAAATRAHVEKYW